MKWAYRSQYFFDRLLYMSRTVFRIWIHLLFFQCPILGVRNKISKIHSWSPGVKREPKPCKALKIDEIKFDVNSHLTLDLFPPVFLSKLICIATSHSSCVMVNITFPVMDELIRGFKPSLNLNIRIVLN